jgi:hypothetical protein
VLVTLVGKVAGASTRSPTQCPVSGRRSAACRRSRACTPRCGSRRRSRGLSRIIRLIKDARAASVGHAAVSAGAAGTEGPAGARLAGGAAGTGIGRRRFPGAIAAAIVAAMGKPVLDNDQGRQQAPWAHQQRDKSVQGSRRTAQRAARTAQGARRPEGRDKLAASSTWSRLAGKFKGSREIDRLAEPREGSRRQGGTTQRTLGQRPRPGPRTSPTSVAPARTTWRASSRRRRTTCTSSAGRSARTPPPARRRSPATSASPAPRSGRRCRRQDQRQGRPRRDPAAHARRAEAVRHHRRRRELDHQARQHQGLRRPGRGSRQGRLGREGQARGRWLDRPARHGVRRRRPDRPRRARRVRRVRRARPGRAARDPEPPPGPDRRDGARGRRLPGPRPSCPRGGSCRSSSGRSRRWAASTGCSRRSRARTTSRRAAGSRAARRLQLQQLAALWIAGGRPPRYASSWRGDRARRVRRHPTAHNPSARPACGRSSAPFPGNCTTR